MARLTTVQAPRSQSGVQRSGSVRDQLGFVREHVEEGVLVGRRCCQIPLSRSLSGDQPWLASDTATVDPQRDGSSNGSGSDELTMKLKPVIASV